MTKLELIRSGALLGNDQLCGESFKEAIFQFHVSISTQFKLYLRVGRAYPLTFNDSLLIQRELWLKSALATLHSCVVRSPLTYEPPYLSTPDRLNDISAR